MKYIVIGLGSFGSELAVRLTQMGHDVIGTDIDAGRCDALRDSLSGIMCMDTSQGNSISSLPLDQAQIVVVTIGRDFGASVQTVAQLRRLGVKRIIARGFSDVHVGVLQTLGVERVLFTEKSAAEKLAQSLTYSDFISSYRVDSNHYVMELIAPKQIVGMTLQQTGLLEDFHLRTLAIKQVRKSRNVLGLSHSQYEVSGTVGPGTVIEPGDIVVIYGTLKSYDSFIRSL